MADYEFPVSQDVPIPAIGTGFDLIAGTLLDAVGTIVKESDLNVSPAKFGGSYFVVISDSASYSDAAAEQLDMAGSGWGASVGLSLTESSLSVSHSTALTLNLDAYSIVTQKIVGRGTKLDEAAMDLLAKKDGSFAKKYGNYFVAGYVYGKRCSVAYRMAFNSVTEKETFTAALTAAYSSTGFDAKLSAAISDTKTSTKTSSKADVHAKFAGFSPSMTPTTLEEITAFKKEFDDAAADSDAPVRIIISPWTHLDCVQDIDIVTVGGGIDTVTAKVNKLGYIIRSCEAFVENELYAGRSQLEAVQGVKQDARDRLQKIIDAIAKGDDVNGNDFEDTADLIDRMHTALSRIVIAFSVQSADDDCSLSSPLKDVHGNLFQASGRVLDGGKGCNLNWSIAGNEGWDPTAGTSRMYHIIAQTDSVHGSANIRAILDRDAGTLQLYRTPDGATFAECGHSNPVVIRGSDNALLSTDPNNPSRAYCALPGNVVLSACPI